MNLLNLASKIKKDKEPKKDSVPFKEPKKGDKVRIPSINITGTIQYVANKYLFVEHYYPIQVMLDEAYEEHVMLRTNLKDLEYI